MRSQIYLVLIRDGRLALTVGAALEDRLLRDGYKAMALVPAVRGPEFADSECRRHLTAWGSGSGPAGPGPQVVALYEDGLLDDLALLGLPAYVGVQNAEEPQIARWADDSGAIMLPVATARDLVDAVADHTPWSRYAAELPSAYPVGAKVTPIRRSRPSGHGSPALPHKKIATVATVAGPLLLAGMPSAAIAIGGSSPAPMLAPAAASSGTLKFVTTADTQPAPPQQGSPQQGSPPSAPAAPPSSPGMLSNLSSNVGNFFSNVGNTISNAMAQYGQAQLDQAQAQQAFWNAVVQASPQAYQAGMATGNQLALPGAAIGGPVAAGIAGLTTAETGLGAIAAGAAAYPAGAKIGAISGFGLGFGYGYLNSLYNSLSSSPAGGNTGQAGTPQAGTSSAPGGNTGGLLSTLGNAVASGDQAGQAVGSPAAKFGGLVGLGYGLSQPATGATATLGNGASSLGNFGATAGALGYTGGFMYGFLKDLLSSPQDPGKQMGGDMTVGPNGVTAPPAAPSSSDPALQAPGSNAPSQAPAAPGTDGASQAPQAPAPGDTGSPNGTTNGNAPNAPAAPGGTGSPNGTTTPAQPPAAPGDNGTPQANAAPGGTGSPNGTTTASAAGSDASSQAPANNAASAAPPSDAAPAAPAAPPSDTAPAAPANDASSQAPAAPASDAAPAAPDAPVAPAAPAAPPSDAAPTAPATDGAPAGTPAVPSDAAPPDAPAVPAPPASVPAPVTSSVSGNTTVAATPPSDPTTDVGTTATTSAGATTTVTASSGDTTGGGADAGGSGGGVASG